MTVLAGFFLGTGASSSVGISVPDTLTNIGGYQVFATLQGQAAASLGGYVGGGIVGGYGSSNGPLQVASASSGWYVEADAGAGYSGGASIQGGWTRDSAGNINGFGSPSGGSFTPAPHVGYGVGVALIGGSQGSVTLATPTFGQVTSFFSSIASVSSAGAAEAPSK